MGVDNNRGDISALNIDSMKLNESKPIQIKNTDSELYSYVLDKMNCRLILIIYSSLIF